MHIFNKKPLDFYVAKCYTVDEPPLAANIWAIIRYAVPIIFAFERVLDFFFYNFRNVVPIILTNRIVSSVHTLPWAILAGWEVDIRKN